MDSTQIMQYFYFWTFWNPSKNRWDRSIWVWNFPLKPPIFLIFIDLLDFPLHFLYKYKGNQANQGKSRKSAVSREIPNSNRPISANFWWISKFSKFFVILVVRVIDFCHVEMLETRSRDRRLQEKNTPRKKKCSHQCGRVSPRVLQWAAAVMIVQHLSGW